jgi:hypothetical protein
LKGKLPFLVVLSLFLGLAAQSAWAQRKTRNAVLVVSDGLRWQEIVTGADPKTTTRLDDEDVWDSFLRVPLLEYVRSAQPRLLFIGYGETDNWAHSGRYDLVLDSAHQFDQFVRQLWETMQALPEYRDHTTFIITTDHGRGSGPKEWKELGAEQKGSENIWIAVMGPDTEALGERSNTAPVTQSEIAATIAQLLGKDFHEGSSDAAPPLPGVAVFRSAK